eukprot:5493880-Amphidinium_carterae.1
MRTLPSSFAATHSWLNSKHEVLAHEHVCSFARSSCLDPWQLHELESLAVVFHTLEHFPSGVHYDWALLTRNRPPTRFDV